MSALLEFIGRECRPKMSCSDMGTRRASRTYPWSLASCMQVLTTAPSPFPTGLVWSLTTQLTALIEQTHEFNGHNPIAAAHMERLFLLATLWSVSGARIRGPRTHASAHHGATPSPHRSVGGLLESGDRLKVDQKLRTMTAKGVLPPPEDENSVYEFRVHEVRNEWALLWGVGSL